MPIEEIRNFAVFSDTISTGGQPTEAQINELAESGFNAVINLGLLDPRYCLPDEQGLVQSLHLDYHHIPVDFNAPAMSNYKAFEGVLSQLNAKRVFVHCAANYRVSCFIALFGQHHLSWSKHQAINYINKIWQPNHTWTEFMELVERELFTKR